jgi:hypothetical protein
VVQARSDIWPGRTSLGCRRVKSLRRLDVCVCVCHDPDVRLLDRWTLSLAHHNYTHSMITILTDVSCTYQESSPSRPGSVGRNPTLNHDLITRSSPPSADLVPAFFLDVSITACYVIVLTKCTSMSPRTKSTYILC